MLTAPLPVLLDQLVRADAEDIHQCIDEHRVEVANVPVGADKPVEGQERAEPKFIIVTGDYEDEVSGILPEEERAEGPLA